MTLERAHRFAVIARLALATVGIAVLLSTSIEHPEAATAGLVLLAVSGVLLAVGNGRGPTLDMVESALLVPTAVLLVGVQGGAASPLAGLWIAAVGCGVLAREARPGPGRIWPVALGLLGCAGFADRVALDLVALGLPTLLLVLACARIGEASRLDARRARYAGEHDTLTGAITHSAFRRRFETALADPTRIPFGMLLVDLDDFGSVNRRAGHLEGDRVLAAVGALLASEAGPGTTLGRLGGDEFGVLVSAADAQGAAERIVAAFARGPVAGHPLGASIGLALVPEDGRDWETVVAGADLALREVKGRGKAAVARHRGGPVREHHALRREVSDLWEKNRITIWVQPIVDAAAGAIHGYEALARFEGGEGPATWFARADAVGMRIDLELACLRKALELFDQRPAGASLSVNLSAGALLREDTHAMLRAKGDLHGLVVEITEEALLAGAANLDQRLKPLIRAGAQVALDDMGTGQASLRHLAELRPAFIKLDRSVVSGLHADPARAALVDAFVGYAERTGAVIVAEGVELHEELECLVALNTPLVQGYLTGRPAPPWPQAVPRIVKARAREEAVVEVSTTTTAEALRRRFEAQPSLAAAVVVGEGAEILGLVTRERLLQALGRQYGHALFARRSVLLLADRRCLVVPDGAPQEVLIRRAVTRPLASRHDPIVLRDADGRLAGAVTMTELLQAGLQDIAVV